MIKNSFNEIFLKRSNMVSTPAATMLTVPQYLACVADKLNPAIPGLVRLQAKETRPSTHVAASPNPHLLHEILVVSPPWKHAVCALHDLCIISHSGFKARFLRWLPRAFTIEHPRYRARVRKGNLVNIPVEIYQYGYCWNKVYFLVVNFWIKAVTMATFHLITGRYIPYFGLNSWISTLSFGGIFSYFATSWKWYCLTF